MIKKALKSIKDIFIPVRSIAADITLGTEVECDIDGEKIPCQELQEPEYSYTGVPAPAYLTDDPWFGPAPDLSDKQKDYMAIEAEYKMQEASSPSVESEDIHELMYQIATQTGSPTTVQLDPPGGSENFHEGPGGWNSGIGYNQFRSN
tara:strand:+ start:3579 stop:4022 length:444 start_codon:yes stop_codon:yes gene_type:complete